MGCLRSGIRIHAWRFLCRSCGWSPFFWEKLILQGWWCRLASRRPPDEETRADGYRAAYIVKGNKSTEARVSVEISGRDPLERVDSLWVDVHWVNYGPFGRLQRRQGVLVPLRQPDPLTPEQASFRAGDDCMVLPLRTHLLGPLDDSIDVLRTCRSPHQARGCAHHR